MVNVPWEVNQIGVKKYEETDTTWFVIRVDKDVANLLLMKPKCGKAIKQNTKRDHSSWLLTELKIN